MKASSTYRWPITLAAVIGIGLLSALLGDGVWDAFSWILLLTPLTTLMYCLRRRTPAIFQSRASKAQIALVERDDIERARR